MGLRQRTGAEHARVQVERAAAGQLDALNGQLSRLNGQISAAKSTGLGLTQQLSVALNNQDGLKNQITLVNGTIQTISGNLNTQS